LLASHGRREEARELAQRFSRAPGSMYELLKLAEINFSLGLADQSRDLLKRFASNYGHSPEVWASYASLLEDLKDWNEMRGVALQIREQRNYRDTLGGFSYFLEGRSDLGLERKTTAETAFRRASESTYEVPGLGLLVAKGLMKLKYHEYARPILRQVESSLTRRDDYWDTAFDCAMQLKDGNWILKISESAYKANPEDVVKVNRYAAALMVNRAQPEEAVKLTMQLLNNYPDSPTAIINHSLALMMNNRYAEAREQLDRLLPSGLSPAEASAYFLASFELHLSQRDFARAKEDSGKINRQALFPAQEKWLEDRLKEFPGSVTANY